MVGFLRVAAVFTLLAWVQLAEAQNGTRTNFLIFLADDLGLGHVGYNGGIERTPNIDKLARGGTSIILTNFHSSPVCSPSRSALYSGQVPEFNCVPGVDTNVVARYGMTTIGNDASKAGYKTAFFGKWHLGGVEKNALGRRGFQSWLASPKGLISYDSPCWCLEYNCNTRPGKCRGVCYINPLRYCSSPASNYCYTGHMTVLEVQEHVAETYTCRMANGTSKKVDQLVLPPAKTQNCFFLANKTEEWLETLSPNDPFLAVVAFHEPHLPFFSDPILRSQSEIVHGLETNGPLANFVAVVESIDKAIGQVMRALDRLGRTKDTFVLFAADNGAEKFELSHVSKNTQYRGSKRTIWEGGIRVPGVISYPKMLNGDLKVDAVTSILDLRPTIRDIIKAETPGLNFVIPPLHGQSLMPFLHNVNDLSFRTRKLFVCGQIGPRGICSSFAYYNGSLKVISYNPPDDTGFERGLFNLTADPFETKSIDKNLAVTFKGMLRNGERLAKSFRQSYRKNKCSHGRNRR